MFTYITRTCFASTFHQTRTHRHHHPWLQCVLYCDVAQPNGRFSHNLLWALLWADSVTKSRINTSTRISASSNISAAGKWTCVNSNCCVHLNFALLHVGDYIHVASPFLSFHSLAWLCCVFYVYNARICLFVSDISGSSLFSSKNMYECQPGVDVKCTCTCSCLIV